jgi:hypothetical protein
VYIQYRVGIRGEPRAPSVRYKYHSGKGTHPTTLRNAIGKVSASREQLPLVLLVSLPLLLSLCNEWLGIRSFVLLILLSQAAVAVAVTLCALLAAGSTWRGSRTTARWGTGGGSTRRRSPRRARATAARRWLTGPLHPLPRRGGRDPRVPGQPPPPSVSFHLSRLDPRRTRALAKTKLPARLLMEYRLL